MEAPRKGRQTPTKSIILTYTETCGQEAIELYNSSGRTVQEWQELLIYVILATNEATESKKFPPLWMKLRREGFFDIILMQNHANRFAFLRGKKCGNKKEKVQKPLRLFGFVLFRKWLNFVFELNRY